MLRNVASRAVFASLLCGALLAAAPARAADPPLPSGSHPRLFMSTANQAAFSAKVGMSGTRAAAMVANCQMAIDKPSNYAGRGGSDADTWPGMAVSCAFAYVVTGQSKYLAPALLYWKAALGDDQTVGDGLGCTPSASTANWKTWNGSSPAPPILLTITHDTGYPIRWYGPDIALAYDWLYNAPGVDDALRTQTRACLGAWIDYYTASGYHNKEAGANYNAGFVIGKTLAAIAIGNDGGADGHLWTETLHDVFATLLVGQGLTGSTGGVGTPAGALVGGDWAEGWQYGPLSVAEYAAATRAVEEAGAPQPEMDAWVNSLAVRYAHGTVPTYDAQYMGNGDFDSEAPYPGPAANLIDAVLVGPSNDQAASWALYMRQQQKPSGSTFIWNVLAELRDVSPQDYRTQSPAAPLWYLARGTRAMYTRTSWDTNAYWAVFQSEPHVVSDHQHFAAGNFVFSRGGDHLIVDPSNYGEPDTLETNAVTVDSAGLTGDYAKTQTPYSKAELVWARGTDAAVFAARSDFARAFDYRDTPSDIPYAHREWVFLPEGEIVTIDRVRTGSASRSMYIGFHANTAGTLALSGAIASGTVGGSTVAIHAASLSGGTPAISKPEVGTCSVSCSYPCGACAAARFAVDDYTVTVPGPYAQALHVIDGLGAGETPAEVGSLNDDNFDPAPKQNAGVIGAAVYRSSKQSYVVASAAQDGAPADPMTYGVPGGSAGRHVVFDAPEAGDGTSKVTAAAAGSRCVVTVTAGSGGGFTGHPLMFQVAAAADGCTVTEDTNVGPGMPPPGGGVGGTGSGGSGGITGGGSTKGGCGCAIDPAGSSAIVALLLGAGWLLRRARRRPN
ncbi:MAG TPA: MYXO-CTERM sorting domain-containing protein [Polyangia bacterium]|nr:MYXO-CTERM sorting domain-containing protein [Polyangia bacterium]